jgi:hypothetical protein
LNEGERENVAAWLGAINDKQMPDSKPRRSPCNSCYSLVILIKTLDLILSSANWLWFRVFANLALRQISPEKHYNPSRLQADLDHLDTFQLRGEESGWSRDGPEGVRQLDYYSGSFAIQFAQMVYSRVSSLPYRDSGTLSEARR